MILVQEGGSQINVTQANKAEYVKLYVDWVLNTSIEKQFRPFYKGFRKVVTGEAIKVSFIQLRRVYYRLS